MVKIYQSLVLCGALLLALAPSTAAQTAPAAAAYVGPRFPGGPDSLRAFVYRSTRLVVPSPAGRMLVQFELKPDGHPYNFTMVRPPARLNKPLVNATAAALNYLEAHMPAWQPGAPDPTLDPDQKQKFSLVIDFTTPPTEQPFEYADQHPVFATLGEPLRTRRNRYFDRILADPAQLARFQSSPQGLTSFVQMQTLYPVEALRSRQQGTVYACFEVAENGAIEHPEILGTAGEALDTEVMRVVKTLPAATTPAQLQGRPVRMRYTLPITFKIQ